MVFLFLLIVLIFINAYFSAAEIAMVSVKKFRIQEEADKGNKRAFQILDLLKDPEEYLSSIQVGITLVGIIEGLYGGEILQKYLEPKFIHWGISAWFSHSLSLVLGVGLITYFTIILGELLPKSLALQFPQKTAFRIVPSFRLFTLAAYPFIRLLTSSTHLLFRIFKIKGSESQKFTDSDLKTFLSLAYRQGTLEKYELKLHENIFSLYDQTIGKIMTPFEDTVYIKESMTHNEVESILRGSTHNYFPVVGTSNKVAGSICAKDFFMNRDKQLRELIQPVCRITEEQTAPELLIRFKQYHNNFAVVIKEDNLIAGVVTIHDIGEVLIGEFS